MYDLLNKADILVSDYSSISVDFLLAHRPVIYLFADFEQYDRERGFVYEPIKICAAAMLCIIGMR
ncbi:MAG: CDP-glycerol glycerophosphotransferase family protein [Eubacterium sp.]|nr:CDP-glycerol glycerophosphotransferase family protein [Eubacterium sp.]